VAATAEPKDGLASRASIEASAPRFRRGSRVAPTAPEDRAATQEEFLVTISRRIKATEPVADVLLLAFTRGAATSSALSERATACPKEPASTPPTVPEGDSAATELALSGGAH
jgi:hypothetical protein